MYLLVPVRPRALLVDVERYLAHEATDLARAEHDGDRVRFARWYFTAHRVVAEVGAALFQEAEIQIGNFVDGGVFLTVLFSVILMRCTPHVRVKCVKRKK